MSNGSQCCALEICCDPPLARRRLPAAMSVFTGVEPDACGLFLDAMAHAGLTFAPAAFADVLPMTITPEFGAHQDQFRQWMVHEGLVFAPAAMRAVIAEIVQIVRRHATV